MPATIHQIINGINSDFNDDCIDIVTQSTFDPNEYEDATTRFIDLVQRELERFKFVAIDYSDFYIVDSGNSLNGIYEYLCDEYYIGMNYDIPE